MCGRYVIKSPPTDLQKLFGYRERPNFPARYNVAPTQPIPIVRLDNGTRSYALARWGFIPAWVKDPRTFALLINARGESVLDKASFRNAMMRRRCLIPADGFYEWAPGTPRRPYFIAPRSGGPMAFAGLWETWTGPNGEEVDTAAIVTTRANRPLSVLHDRMPAIVAPEAFDLWLDCAAHDATAAAALIAPATDDLLEWYEVSPAVNRATNDSADLIAPAPAPPDGDAGVKAETSAKAKKPDGQLSLF
jgi:putative SOS response-associated peptidase YedK